VTDTLLLQPPRERTSGTFYYGWVNLVIAALAMVATLPGRTQGLGLITVQLLKSLNVSPVQFASYNGWATLIGSSFCLACGPLIDRFGARAVLTATLAALGATVLFMSRVTGPAGLLITLVLTRGLGQSALSVVSLALVGKWFSKKLPLAMGIFSLLVGIGFMTAFPVVGHSVINHGWRPVWSIVGWSLVGFMAIAWLLARRTPESIGLVVDGGDEVETTPKSSDDSETGFTLAEALASPAFWAYALAASLFGLISAGLMLFNESILKEHGFDSHMAVNVIAVVFFAGLVANVVGGMLGGKWPVGRLMACAMFLLAVSLICLPLARGKSAVYSYAVLNGVAGGIVTVAFFVCWGKVFGRRHLGSIQGAAQGLTVITSSAGPILLAECVHHFGSSQPLFYALAPVVAVLGVFCALAPVPKLVR
jgi:MFS family permease